MKDKITIAFLIFDFISCLSFCQEQVKSVHGIGGEISVSDNYESICVVGEIAVSQFETGPLSGSIGYLDDSDSLVLSLFENYQNDQILLYPNPADGKFRVQLFGEYFDNDTVLSIYDSKGSEIFESGKNSFSNCIFEYEDSLPSGIYMVQVRCRQKFSSVRLIVI
jgi:hypothetical protein